MDVGQAGLSWVALQAKIERMLLTSREEVRVKLQQANPEDVPHLSTLAATCCKSDKVYYIHAKSCKSASALL